MAAAVAGCAGAGVGEEEEVPLDGILPSGKLSLARKPRNLVAATSYAMAASSAVSNVPSQTRAAFLGSRISAAHFPHGRCRTPRYLRFFAGDGVASAAGAAGGGAARSAVLTLTLPWPPLASAPSPVVLSLRI